MAQTTTAKNACLAVIRLADSGGTQTDISGTANNFSVDFSNEIGSAYTFDGDFPIRLGCKRDAAIEIEAVYSTGASEARALIEEWVEAGGTRLIEIFPAGNSTGDPAYFGEVFLEEYNFSGAADEADPMSLSASMLPSGRFEIGQFVS